MRGRLRDLLAVLSPLVTGCLASPFEPAGARQVAAPPPVYAVWWQQMEACAGIRAPLIRIEWYEVPGEAFATPDGARWGWWEPPHAIYVAEAHRWDAWLVEHEMLHDLLQTGAHPTLFRTCGVQEPGPAAEAPPARRAAPLAVGPSDAPAMNTLQQRPRVEHPLTKTRSSSTRD